MRFGTLTNRADGLDILLCESILVRINDNPVMIERKIKRWRFGRRVCYLVAVVFGILYEFIYKACIFGIEICGETI
jgi:hypothetical protein